IGGEHDRKRHTKRDERQQEAARHGKPPNPTPRGDAIGPARQLREALVKFRLRIGDSQLTNR
ncbi:MAG: hypothetical protein MUO37_08190, partial [Methyloceanibacter sp.]|nr:hypothetical protein [Methyloceanibacter sp.]